MVFAMNADRVSYELVHIPGQDKSCYKRCETKKYILLKV